MRLRIVVKSFLKDNFEMKHGSDSYKIKFGYIAGLLIWILSDQAIFADTRTSIDQPGKVTSEAGTQSQVKDWMAKHRWEEAIPALRLLEKSETDLLPIRLSLATALTYIGHREEALGVLLRSYYESKGPEKNFLRRRVQVLSRLFLTNKTFQAYQDGLNLLMSQKYRSARERFEKALSEEPDNIEILIRLGQSLILDNNISQSIPMLRAAKRFNPLEPEVRLWLGRAIFLNQGGSESFTELRAAHFELKGSELAAVWYAEALFSSGQLNSAIRVLDADLKDHPFHVLSLITVAKLRMALGRSDTSLLWAARKDLQLAMSRLDQYLTPHLPLKEIDLSIDHRKSEAEIKAEIQKLSQQIESRLNSNSAIQR
jgi:tetratricopeptide (TPR) repeat protein